MRKAIRSKETPYEAQRRQALVHAVVVHWKPEGKKFGLSLGEKVRLAYAKKSGA